MSWSLRSSYLCLEIWGHHIYVLKFEVVIFMSWSLRSSYLCLEVWDRHIYVWKFEVIIFMFGSLRSSYLCLEVCLRRGLSVMILLVKLYCWFVLVKTSISNSMHTMCFSNNLHQVCSMPKNLKVFWSKKYKVPKSISKIVWGRRTLALLIMTWAGAAYPSGAPEFTPGFKWGSCYSIFRFICIFCKSFIILLYFFIWPLCCLFFYGFWLPLLYLQTLLKNCKFR
jgi:hypothetical protein